MFINTFSTLKLLNKINTQYLYTEFETVLLIILLKMSKIQVHPDLGKLLR